MTRIPTTSDVLTAADVMRLPPRQHPNLFTAEEAAAYLHLDSVRGLETLRKNFGLVGFEGVNKSMMYWREDLDACALKIVGRDLRGKNVQNDGRLRIAGARA